MTVNRRCIGYSFGQNLNWRRVRVRCAEYMAQKRRIDAHSHEMSLDATFRCRDAGRC